MPRPPLSDEQIKKELFGNLRPPRWKVGQRVRVSGLKAYAKGLGLDFVDWSGDGEIDMISHDYYFRIVDGTHIAWVYPPVKATRSQNTYHRVVRL